MVNKKTDNTKYVEVEIPPNKLRTFQLGDYPELIHIIKTGFDDEYIVVYEDAHGYNMGGISIGSKKEIEKKIDIKL